LLASEPDDAWPILIVPSTPTNAPSAASARIAATHRRRTMSFAHAVQLRLALFSWRTFGQSIFGPMPPSRAGVKLRVVRTLASGMSAPP